MFVGTEFLKGNYIEGVDQDLAIDSVLSFTFSNGGMKVIADIFGPTKGSIRRNMKGLHKMPAPLWMMVYFLDRECPLRLLSLNQGGSDIVDGYFLANKVNLIVILEIRSFSSAYLVDIV